MSRRARSLVVVLTLVSAFMLGRDAAAQRKGKKPLPAAPGPAPAVVSPAPAAADPSEAGRQKARELLQQGNRLLDQGNYLDALRIFEQAYAAFPSPKLHFNIAQTLNELGRLLDALSHYEQFVRDVKREESPQQWGLANERIFKLQGSIAVMQLQCNIVDAQVTVDGTVVGATPIAQPLRFMPGRHAVVVSKAGFEQRVIEVTLKPGDAVTQRVQLLSEEEGAATKRAVQAAEARRLAALEEERRTKEKLQRTRKILRTSGWSAMGTGVVVMAVGGIFGGLSVSESNKVESAPKDTPWSSVSGHYQNADTYRKILYYGLAAGGAVLVVGAVLVGWSYRGAGAERPPEGGAAPAAPRLTALPYAGAGGGGLVLGGRF